MKADREKRAMILTAEGQRESAIRSAEGQKQSQILTAEGAKQAAILTAEAERQSRILRAQGERAAAYLQAQGEAKAIEKVFAAIKSGRPTPELLAYQYLQTLPQMAQGDANKVWIVPSDFGKALEGFTKMLGAPGGDGVFRFEPSPVDESPSRPEDDDEAIKDWFDTSPDPEIARVVADAEAQARAGIPGFAPTTPLQATQQPPNQLPSAGGPRVGLPAAPQPPSGATPAPSAPPAPGPSRFEPGAPTRPVTRQGARGPRPDRTRRRPPRRAPRQARVRDRRPEPVQGRGPRRGARRPRPGTTRPMPPRARRRRSTRCRRCRRPRAGRARCRRRPGACRRWTTRPRPSIASAPPGPVTPPRRGRPGAKRPRSAEPPRRQEGRAR